jgi:hypothetical protein
MTTNKRKTQRQPKRHGGAEAPVDAEIRRAAERAGIAVPAQVTFGREDLDLITSTLDEAILSGVAVCAASGCPTNEMTETVVKAGVARLLIQDQIERTEQPSGGAS